MEERIERGERDVVCACGHERSAHSEVGQCWRTDVDIRFVPPLRFCRCRRFDPRGSGWSGRLWRSGR